jgi:hypothetical protein
MWKRVNAPTSEELAKPYTELQKKKSGGECRIGGGKRVNASVLLLSSIVPMEITLPAKVVDEIVVGALSER